MALKAVFGSCKSISGKENIFMCLVTFQKFFWKIFFGVWRRRRKRQTRQTKKKDSAIAPRSSRSRLTARSHRSSIAISPIDEWRRSRIAIDERARWTIAPLVDRAVGQSMSALVGRLRRSSIGALRSGLSLLSLSLSSIWALSSLSLSLSFSENELKWKWGCKFISGSKA